jgi:uncharacterized membrane protein YqjE
MEPATEGVGPIAASSRRLARRLVTIGENRLELLMVELQEERERFVRAILLALGVAAFGLLTGTALTGLIVVSFRGFPPAAVLAILTFLYAAAAAWFYWRLDRLMRDWKSFSATLDQLKKDAASLKHDPP